MQTGPRIYNLFPLLAGPIKSWPTHLPRIAQMGFDWIFLNPFALPGQSGSLYAIRNPRELHPVVRGDASEPAEDLIHDFMMEADRHGLKVMMDLVINHTAKDSLLAEKYPDWYVRNHDGSLHSPGAVDPNNPNNVTVWHDLADLNYRDGRYREAQITYWNNLIAYRMGLGCKGFRCDAAYQVPVEIWRPIIETARKAEPTVLMAAETLGCTVEQTRALERAGFDYLFNSSKWWDWQGDWLLQQYNDFRTIAPSISFPESHDTNRLIADLGTGDEGRIRREYQLRYLFSAVFSTGVMMTMGYENGFAKSLHVVHTRPDDWHNEMRQPRFDLSGFVAAVHRMKAGCPPLNVEGLQVRLTPPNSEITALLRYDAKHAGEAKSCVVSLINPDPWQGRTVDPGHLIGNLEVNLVDVTEVTPERPAEPFQPGRGMTIDPQSMRVFLAQTSRR